MLRRGGSQYAEPVIGGSQRAACLQGVPQPVFLRCFGQCPADGLVGELSRDDDSPVVIGHHKVPRADLQTADDSGLPPRGNRDPALAIQRQRSPAPYRVAEGSYGVRVAAVSVDQGAAGTAGAGRGGEQFAPAGGAGRSARGDEDDFSRPDVVKCADLAGVGLGGDLVGLGDQEWVGRAPITAPRPSGPMAGSRQWSRCPRSSRMSDTTAAYSRLSTTSGRTPLPSSALIGRLRPRS